MPRNQTTGNLALANFEDIFNVGLSNADGERVVQIPLHELHAPEFHPFNVTDDAAMYRLAESVRKHGVREPGLARPRTDGGYELICGNRRKRASELAERVEMPVIIRELDDNLAALIMVDSNLEQRETILPSERAWAYKVMMDALNHSGIKGESHSYEIMVERTGVTKSQIFRIIRLTELTITLLDKVDAKQLALNPAVELSYLSLTEQAAVAEAMATYEVRPSLSQAVRLKKLKQEGKLSIPMIDRVLSEDKKPLKSKSISNDRYRRFFPQNYTQNQIDKVIVELLTDWKAKAAV